MKSLRLLALLWGMLWLGGSFWAASSLRSTMQQHADERLAQAGPLFKDIRPVVSGLSVTLTGKAGRASDLAQAADFMKSDLRIPSFLGSSYAFNPVRSVVNEITLELRPQGWGVLAATSGAVHLRGIAGSAMEANRLGLAVRSAGQLGPGFTSDLEADGERFIESASLETTLQSTPALTDQVKKLGLLAVTTWGRPWQMLDVAKPAETLRQDIQALGLPDDAWETDLYAEVERVRTARADHEADEKESQRLAALAPGHVILALRGEEVLVRGELGSERAAQLLADAIRLAAKDRIVIDELAHSSHRRPDETSRLLATSLPSLPSGMLVKFVAVGTPEAGWKVIEPEALNVEDLSTLTQAMLPTGLDLRLVLPDMKTSLVWLHSIDSTPIDRGGPRHAPWFMLAAVGKHVYLRGAVADEAVRTQVKAAARRLYSGRELDADVRLDASCLSLGQALQTLATLPSPPPVDAPGFIAFAFSGDEWHSQPASLHLLETSGLQASGLLPGGVSTNVLLPDILAVAPAVRSHLARLALNQHGLSPQPLSPP